jgi:transposase
MLRYAYLACVCTVPKLHFRSPNTRSTDCHPPRQKAPAPICSRKAFGIPEVPASNDHSKPIGSGIPDAAPPAYFKRPYRKRPGLFLVRLCTQVKNRIHATLARHRVQVPGTDLFGVEARLQLDARLPELPTHSRETVVDERAVLDFLELQIDSAEQRLQVIRAASPEADLLKTLPGVGKILSRVLMLEIGKVERFPTAAHLASYAGLAPRVHSSGGHTRMGQVCGNVNRNLKWALVEAGNLVVIHQRQLAGTHVVRLYQRIKRRKNHQKAVVAVARHLAEASYWVLTKQEVYREPRLARQALSSTHG